MRSLPLIIILLSAAFVSSGQVRPFFTSVIVSNVEASSDWYSRVFDLKVKTRDYNDSYGYKLVILENNEIGIELMELKGAISPQSLPKNGSEDARVMGLFKAGFKVPDMDKWIAHLNSLNIKVDKVWKDDKTGKRNFMINDPDGNIVQFFD